MFVPAIHEVREGLLALHKTLIDAAREQHEQAQGRRLTPGELLQLLTTDAAFDWLHPFSQLIVAIDELLERGTPPTEDDAAAVRLEAQAVLDHGGARYQAAIDTHPTVAFEHGRTTAALERLPDAPPEQHAALRALRAGWRAQRKPRR